MFWHFVKYTGCGNDFIIFDNRSACFPLSPSLVQNLCQRQWGIGADGMVLLENSTQADVRMRIFNADGNEAEMCGNGIRCLIHWLYSNCTYQSTYLIETAKGLLKGSFDEGNVCIDMGVPTDFKWNAPLSLDSITYLVHCLNTGVPHAVLFVSNIEEVNIDRLGPMIRYHALWQPHGINATFAQKLNDSTIAVRTYERGVERETLACGTGATAAALAAAYQFQMTAPQFVKTRSGAFLKIDFVLESGIFSNVKMTGPAQRTFQGEVNLSNFS
ncbi:MAG: diaminopimelate epimerase [Candidatus Protochlamydia sp.]|nr:diaminopimelate epimerase [Candidatus Protochlamydia sp.]